MGIRGPYDSSSASGSPRTFGERIKALRVLKGMTQVELGEALCTDQATISLWERDRVRPSGAAMAGVAAFFGLPHQTLETGIGFALPGGSDQPVAPKIQGDSSLPEGLPGFALAKDKRLQTWQCLDPMGAMGFLMKALKEGRAIWILAE